MVDIFKYVNKFFMSLADYLTYNYIFLIFVGLFLLLVFTVVILTSRSYEARLIKAVDKFNLYFIDNPQINEENLVAFNEKMKSKRVPKQLRKHWQQFVLYREDKASSYMSFENCVSNPIKNSSYTRDVKIMGTLAYVFSLCAFILNCYYCFETGDLASILRSVLLTPIIILLLNYIVQMILNLRHSAIVSDLFQNYQYFEVNIDKATETLPEYVDYEVLFDRNEIKKGIPILYAYLQKRAEEEQRELERARLKNVEHEKFNFDDQGVAASLVLERAMQEAENYIAERKKYNQDIEQINADITQEDMNYREITKEYNRQMQVSKETFANFKAQLEEASSTIEANYLKKQQQQELDRQRNLERDFDTATERHKKVIEGFHAELDTVDKFIAQSRKSLENAMKSEFSSYSSKVYDEAKKVVEEREKEKTLKLKQNITNLEEQLYSKKQELENVYQENQNIGDKLLEMNNALASAQASGKKSKKDKQPVVNFIPTPVKNETPVEEKEQETKQYQPLTYQTQQETDKVDDDSENDDDSGSAPLEYKPLSYEPQQDYYKEDKEDSTENSDETTEEPVTTEYKPLTYERPEFLNEFKEENSDDEPNNNESSAMSYERPSFLKDFEENKDGFESPAEEKSSAMTYETPSYLQETEDENEEETKNQNGGQDKEKRDINKIFDELFGPAEKPNNSFADAEEDDDEISTEQTGDSIENTPSRRGRPRKVVDEVETQGEKKRPGRPRKILTEEDIKPKRKVGRPRKEKVETVKKSPGRPRKEVTETISKKPVGRPRKTETDKPVKRPGRPRKEKSTTVKKGPGRPRKEDTKKGPGRPKKVSVEVSVRKGPGRPRKTTLIANGIDDIDAYLQEIDNAIAAENAKMLRSEKALANGAKLKRKK